MLLIFEICLVVSSWFAVPLAWLVTTDVPDIVDVFVGSPLGTSDRCFCQLYALGRAICTEVQYPKNRLSEASYQLGQCPLCTQELYLEHHFEVS